MNASTTEIPDIQSNRSYWFVWIVPVVSLIIGIYLLYHEYAEKGPVIVITFQDGSGLEPKRTQVLSKGVVVGTVESVQLTQDLQQVQVHARLYQSTSSLAREGSRIWIERPEINTSGIHGLESIVTGPYIRMEPGTGPASFQFEGLNQRPRNSLESHEYKLVTQHLRTARPGASVIYRGIQVGSVDSVDLSDNSNQVIVTITIEEPYYQLIRKGSKFWDAGGVDMKVNLMGAQIRADSLASVLSGSIEFATPPEVSERPVAQSGSRFILHDKPDQRWLEWEAGIQLSPASTENTSFSELSLLESAE